MPKCQLAWLEQHFVLALCGQVSVEELCLVPGSCKMLYNWVMAGPRKHGVQFWLFDYVANCRGRS